MNRLERVLDRLRRRRPGEGLDFGQPQFLRPVDGGVLGLLDLQPCPLVRRQPALDLVRVFSRLLLLLVDAYPWTAGFDPTRKIMEVARKEEGEVRELMEEFAADGILKLKGGCLQSLDKVFAWRKIRSLIEGSSALPEA